MPLTCAYGTDWLPVNIIIILLTFLIVSGIYMLSRFFPSSFKGKLVSIVKQEISTALISVIILLVIFSFSNLLCGVTSSIAQQIQSSSVTPSQQPATIPFPALTLPSVPTTSDPFQYSESYVGNYAFGVGPILASQIYGYSYTYGIEQGVWTQFGYYLTGLLPSLTPVDYETPALGLKISFPLGVDLGVPYGILSNLLLDVFSPFVVLGIGMMLVQFVLLVIIENYAFAVILPIAIMMRAIPLSTGHLRNAANAVLAIAIALYLIYPAMVVFDTYALNWLFTPCLTGTQLNCNPTAVYVQGVYRVDPLDNVFASSQSTSIHGVSVPLGQSIENFFAGAPIGIINSIGGISGMNGDQAVIGLQSIILKVSEYLFAVIVMFAINFSVTLGFAMGLTKALNSGVEGASQFWGNL
ncbi:MAG: hypothetical protein M1504_01040 [Candidatus Marsarchaeota archaeon]|nr:hypothetical protein [Candidatus Marsarchaeota archaeon]